MHMHDLFWTMCREHLFVYIPFKLCVWTRVGTLTVALLFEDIEHTRAQTLCGIISTPSHGLLDGLQVPRSP